MKRTIVVIGVGALAIAAVAAPWVIGWRAEQLMRSRVAQVEADKNAMVRLRIDSYERGWGGANARISVVDRDGTPLLTLPAAIRHWPFASGGPADWVSVPEFGKTVRDALGPWGVKLPELTTRTQLSWGGDVLTRIESPALKRRVPEVAGGTLEVGAVAGTVDWRRNGALAYDIALPVLRVDRQPMGRTDGADVAEFRDAVLKGEGWLGTVERRWNQKGSLAASSVSVTEAGKTILTATNPVVTFESSDQGEHVGVQCKVAISAVGARHALQNFSDAALEFGFNAQHLAKEPLGRLLDAAANPTERPTTKATPRSKGRAQSKPPSTEIFDDLLRGSPAADLRFMLKAQEGRFEVKLALAFDGQGYEPNIDSEAWIQRVEAELNTRASTSLVLNAIKASAELTSGMLHLPDPNSSALPDAAPRETDALARRQLQEAAAQGWIRIEGEEVATTLLWRRGNLTINGQDMNVLRDLARGMTAR